jgi:hypothetical protein
MIKVMLKSHSHLRLRDPGTAYGTISTFSVHATYLLGYRDALDKLFREDHLAWEKMGRAAQSLVTRNQQASNTVGPPLFRINGCWEYKGKQIVDRGFILFGQSNSLPDFMKSYNRPYILKTETETETVSVFSNRGNNADSVFIGDLEDPRLILERIYGRLRAGTVFGNYTLSSVTESLPGSSIRARRALDFLHALVERGQYFFGETSPDSAGEEKSVWTVIADQQGTEIFAATFWWCVPADDELLLQGEFYFDPGAAALAGFIGGVFSLGHQTLEPELACNPDKLFSGPLQLLRELDILRSFL